MRQAQRPVAERAPVRCTSVSAADIAAATAAWACGLFFQHDDPERLAPLARMSRASASASWAKVTNPICSSRTTTVGPTPLTARRTARSAGEKDWFMREGAGLGRVRFVGWMYERCGVTAKALRYESACVAAGHRRFDCKRRQLSRSANAALARGSTRPLRRMAAPARGQARAGSRCLSTALRSSNAHPAQSWRWPH